MKRFLLFAALALGLTAAEARAGIIVEMTFDPQATIDGGLWVDYYHAGNPLGPNQGGYTGRYAFSYRQVDPPDDTRSGALFTYCLDFVTGVAMGTRLYDTQPLDTYTARADALRSLVNVVNPTGLTNPWDFTGMQSWAFQMAVWEIVTETSLDFSLNFGKGSFYVTGGDDKDGIAGNGLDWELAKDQANTWLGGVSGATTPNINVLNPIPPGSGQAQGILADAARFGNPVPEPSALCLWAGLALVGCGVRFRRRSQT